jgi:hypothetical protein
MSERSRRLPDPLKREVPPEQVPLQSPMPRSPALDKEEPELSTDEPDIPQAEAHPDPKERRHETR